MQKTTQVLCKVIQSRFNHRYWNTLRYLRPVQIYGRLWFRLYRPRVISDASLSQRPLTSDPVAWIPHYCAMTGRDSFCFLNEKGNLDKGWEPASQSNLWRYNLHYFDYLNAGNLGKRGWQRTLLSRWIKENPLGRGSGWNSYPLSLRIVNWIKWLLKENDHKTDWLNSLAVQTRYLSKRLEYHLLGNHLFGNLKALVFSGCFFQGSEADDWLAKGATGIEKQLNEQILSDGGHLERSPMYHSIILEDILDLINVISAHGNDLSNRYSRLTDLLSQTAERMLRWLDHMTHPDGQIVLFNDAALHIAPSLESLRDYAQRLSIKASKILSKPMIHLADSGYIRVVAQSFTAFLDVAPIGPDYLPAHGHADTLSFELSFEKRRFIVDSGTSCYEGSVERMRQRSTAAHNTVEIDGQNSSEIWGAFRVARRAYPQGLTIKGSSGEVVVDCSHDGYRRLPGKPSHHRRWRFEGRRFIVSDTVSGDFFRAVSRFHFHPDIQVYRENQDSGRCIFPDGKRLYWVVKGGLPSIVTSTYHPEFGVSLSNQCLEVVLEGRSCGTEFHLL